jgi:hypothetical protein
MDPHNLQWSYQIIGKANRTGRFLTLIFLNASLSFQFSATVGASGRQLICVMLGSIFHWICVCGVCYGFDLLLFISSSVSFLVLNLHGYFPQFLYFLIHIYYYLPWSKCYYILVCCVGVCMCVCVCVCVCVCARARACKYSWTPIYHLHNRMPLSLSAHKSLWKWIFH